MLFFCDRRFFNLLEFFFGLVFFGDLGVVSIDRLFGGLEVWIIGGFVVSLFNGIFFFLRFFKDGLEKVL